MENRIMLADKFVGELFVLSVKVNELESWKEENHVKVESYGELKKNLDRAEEALRSMKRTVSLNSNALVNPSEKSEAECATVEERVLEIREASLEGMNEKLLLDIFGFLDAIDVLKSAQVNISFYSKVDSLFGLGGEAADDVSDVVESSSVPVEPPIEPLPMTNPVPSASSKFLTSEVPSPVKASKYLMSEVPAQVKEAPKENLLKDLLNRQPKDLFNGQAFRDQSARGAQTMNKVFSFLHKTETPPNTLPLVSSEMTPMLASSMADKLTTAELSVIINMTEKLKEKDNDITRITAEREDLTARLQSTESVKEFMILKVRDLELSQEKNKLEKEEMRIQTVKDQEVISFLDSRVKELEREKKDTLSKRIEAEKGLKSFRKQSGEKMKIIEDMLLFERQQLQEQDKEWKSQKKLLVKEIKHCRGQIVTLQVERDSFAQQNTQIKQALFNKKGSVAVNR